MFCLGKQGCHDRDLVQAIGWNGLDSGSQAGKQLVELALGLVVDDCVGHTG